MVVVRAEPESAAAANDGQVDEHERQERDQDDEEHHYKKEARKEGDVVDHATRNRCIFLLGPFINYLRVSLSFDDVVRGLWSGFGHCFL